MDELLDRNTRIDRNKYPLVDLVEAFIVRKRNGTPIITRNFRIKLEEIGYSQDQIEDILIEMRNDANIELRSGIGLRKAKRNLIIGLVIGSLALILSMTVNLGKSITIPVLALSAGMLVIGRSYSEIGMVKKRKKRRFIKYKKWSLERIDNLNKRIPDFSDENRFKQELNSDHFFQPRL